MIKILPRTHYQTRAVTQSTGNTKPATVQSGTTSIPPKGMHSSKEKETEISNTLINSNNKQKPTILETVVKAIHMIINKDKLDKKVRASLENMLKFISNMEEKENKRAESAMAQPEVSTLYKAIKQDLSRMHEALARQMDGVLDTASATLTNTEKTLTDTQNLKEETKEISSKVRKVNDATTMQSYHDILAQSLAAVSKPSLDPKVLGDMECRAQQILIDIFNEDGNNTLSKSLTELIAKANETIGKIEDVDKPAKVYIESALQTCKGGLILTLNNKEAANWLRQTEHEMAFTEGFSKGLHIRERSYNLIMPRVPIIFELENRSHLREIEEANNLMDQVIHKARWIKLVAR